MFMANLKFCEVPQPLEKRIEIVWEKEDQIEFEPNCYGTAFFILGVLPYDMVIFTGKNYIREAISRMEQLEHPINNSIIFSFIDQKLKHASFIKSVNPFQGYHRRGSEGEFEAFSKIQDIEDYLYSSSHSVLNILPSRKPVFSHKFYSLSPSDNLSDWAKKVVEAYHPGWYA